mmetsp:Transcript_62401/g.182351  ORF Transcript_62401/g.182351 Transcript_62401/m.182351 type:complete len:126 (+) Transcript_62401:2516-2893(+)
MSPPMHTSAEFELEPLGEVVGFGLASLGEVVGLGEPAPLFTVVGLGELSSLVELAGESLAAVEGEACPIEVCNAGSISSNSESALVLPCNRDPDTDESMLNRLNWRSKLNCEPMASGLPSLSSIS